MIHASEAVLGVVGDIVDLLVGETVTIFAKQPEDTPRPIGFYVDVDLITDTSIGWEEKTHVDDLESPDIVETNKGYREFFISIGFYRDDAIDKARLVKIGFVRQSVLDMLSAAKLGLAARSEVRDISEVFESTWEKRAQFDLTLSAVDSDSDIVTAIESATINGEFQTRGLRIPITVEVNP